MYALQLVRTGFFGILVLAFIMTKLTQNRAALRGSCRGSVVNLDQATCQIKVQPQQPKGERTFKWDEATRFFDNEGPISPSQMRRGQIVRITPAEKQAGLASRVEIEPVLSTRET